MEKIKNLLIQLRYAKLELIDKYIVYKTHEKNDMFCAKIIELKNGMFLVQQNMSNRIFKHWFSKDEYHFGDWKLNRDTENKDKEGILCPTGIANITLPCNN